MKEVQLTQGQVALVDDCDFGWLSESKWCATWNPHTKSFYARCMIPTGPYRQRTIRMHRAIWEHYHGLISSTHTVDHADRISLNNRRSNLRLATPSQQSQNRGMLSSNASGYRGVYWHKQSGTWRAQIRVDGKPMHLGNHSDPEDAARSYDAAALVHFDPEFARLNFPERAAS